MDRVTLAWPSLQYRSRATKILVLLVIIPTFIAHEILEVMLMPENRIP